MVSIFVGAGNVDEVEHWDEKQTCYVKVTLLEVVRLYSEAMGGVDFLDRLVSLPKNWTLRMITHAFDLAIVNRWSEYGQDPQKKDIPDLLHFKMNVTECLLNVQKPVGAKRGRHSMSPEPVHDKHQYKQQAQDLRPLPEVQFDLVDHMPAYDDKNEASRCKRLHRTGKTHVFCDNRNLHLCFVPSRNGFKAAYTRQYTHRCLDATCEYT